MYRYVCFVQCEGSCMSQLSIQFAVTFIYIHAIKKNLNEFLWPSVLFIIFIIGLNVVPRSSRL